MNWVKIDGTSCYSCWKLINRVAFVLECREQKNCTQKYEIENNIKMHNFIDSMRSTILINGTWWNINCQKKTNRWSHEWMNEREYEAWRQYETCVNHSFSIHKNNRFCSSLKWGLVYVFKLKHANVFLINFPFT